MDVKDHWGNTATYQTWATDYVSATDISLAVTGDMDAITHVEDYSALAKKMLEIVQRNADVVKDCRGTVVVEKQIVDSEGNVIPDGERSGWEFTEKGPQSNLKLVDLDGNPTSPLSRITSTEGRVRFVLSADLPRATETILIEETPQDGYVLRPQDGSNAVCRDSHGVPVATVNEGTEGFRVVAATGRDLHCVVQNVQGGFAVAKALHGDEPKATIAFDGTFTATYDITVTNSIGRASELKVPVVDTVVYPEGFTVEEVTFIHQGQPISDVERDGNFFRIPADALNPFSAGEVKTITVEVQGRATAEAQKNVVDGLLERCEWANPENAQNPRGLFNGVSLEGEDDPEGERNNYACIDPEQPGIEVSKDVAEVDVHHGEEATRSVTYTVTVTNPEKGITRTYELVDTPAFSDTVTIDHAYIASGDTLAKTGLFPGGGPYDVTSVLNGGEPVEIGPGETHTYTVTVRFTGPRASSDQNSWQCSADGEGQGLFNSVELTSGAVTDTDDDCAPVPPPGKVTLKLEKVGADDLTTPLAGAAFAVHEVAEDGSPGPFVAELETDAAGYHVGELEAGVLYLLIETKSPQDYQLLPTPVKVMVRSTTDGNVLKILNRADVIGASVRESDDADVVVLQVADVRIGTLPKTGGVGVGVLAALGVLIIGAGVVVARRRGA